MAGAGSSRGGPAGGEGGVGVGVADDLRGEPPLLAVGEAALELLEAVAAGDPAAEVDRHLPFGRELDHGLDHVLHRRVAQIRVGRAGEVVVEEAVGLDGDRGGRDAAAGRAAITSQALSARGSDRSRPGRRSSARRHWSGASSAVGGEETGPVLGRSTPARARSRSCSPRFGCLRICWRSSPGSSGQSRVGEQDDVALAGSGQRRVAEGVAEEDGDQAGPGEVDRGGVDRRRVDPSGVARRATPGIPVGRDRVEPVGARDLPDHQRCQELAVAGLDPTASGSCPRLRGTGANGRSPARRRRAAVGDEFGGSRRSRHVRDRGEELFRDDPPDLEVDPFPSSRLTWPLIVPSYCQPRRRRPAWRRR